MEKRTNRIEILFTDSELERLKERSKGFSSISSYIRLAIAEFSDRDMKSRMEAVELMTSLYRKYKDELGWAGGNLNQAMKRANELAVAGLMNETYYKEVLLPSIQEIKGAIDKMIAEHSDVVNMIVRGVLKNGKSQ